MGLFTRFVLTCHQVSVSDETSLMLGLQGGYVIRDLDFNSFIFGDQISDRGFMETPTAESFPGEQRGFVDISSGFLLFGPQMWLGVSAHHLNRPNQSLYGGEDRLPTKVTAHVGYVIATRKTRRRLRDLKNGTITPILMYKAQGKSDQASVGFYANFNPIIFGFWYRGLPLKRYDETLMNRDAIAMVTGIRYKKLTVAYSYDATVSELSGATGGSHEISLQFDFSVNFDYQKQPRRRSSGPILCPTPWNSL